MLRHPDRTLPVNGFALPVENAETWRNVIDGRELAAALVEFGRAVLIPGMDIPQLRVKVDRMGSVPKDEDAVTLIDMVLG
jgi:hypothetical protein